MVNWGLLLTRINPIVCATFAEFITYYGSCHVFLIDHRCLIRTHVADVHERIELQIFRQERVEICVKKKL